MTETTIDLNDGKKMPLLGLGTWQSNPGEVSTAIKAAFDAGYRLLDCAHIYQNQPEIGQALIDYFKNNDKIQRKNVFITSKVWNTYHSYEATLKEIDVILEELKLDYVDLMLIHWPTGFKEGTGEWFPADPAHPGKVLYSDVDYLDTWRALEQKVKEGKIHSIGVSNFAIGQIKRIIDSGVAIKPAVNQVELHPFFQQKELVNYCKSEGIVVTAYSPLGNPALPEIFGKSEDRPSVFTDPTLTQLAKKHNKTNAQIVIRALIQQGISVIPKSVNPERIRQNIDVWDFTLDADDLAKFATVDANRRFLDLSARDGDHPHFPWPVTKK